MKYSLFALSLIVTTSIASAGSINTPSGLNPGDQFRIVFVTDSTTTATDATFATYDNLVRAEASGTTYNGTSVTWKAIVSTSSVNAIDHIGQSTTTDIPVYLVDGTEVAASDSSTGLWSRLLSHPINENIAGNTVAGHYSVWTGTDPVGNSNYPVGGSIVVTFGRSDMTLNAWVDNYQAVPGTQNHLYGISEVLTVPSAATVPEPSTMMLSGLGGLTAFAFSLKRKWASDRR